ncbi:MAG: phage tail tape measure protein [Lachnospiraceae bacterium]|nr:phage tail tape measure protein [Lachnospiraceae bacterium]
MLEFLSSIYEKFEKLEPTLSDLKDIDTFLTRINQTTELTKTQLKALGDSSYDSASKYGIKATDYFSNLQNLYSAGHKNAAQLAELSALAQSAGGLEADLANDYLTAADAAYGYSGNVKKLNALLDSQNQVSKRNTVNMEELASATKTAAKQFSNSGIAEDEMTALLGTGIASSGESGENVGTAMTEILQNLQEQADVTGKNPMKLLEEISKVYTSMPDGSIDQTKILSQIGGQSGGNVLDGILSNWDLYQTMLDDYGNASGFAAEQAKLVTNSWEGSLNQLSNTWTETIGNVADSDAVVTILHGLNSLLASANKVSETLGSWGSIGLGAGLFAGLKNVGREEMYSLSRICLQ